MINYGEELAYWYLRFNGFFLITDFVMHPHETRPRPSDCDLLAIRHPHVRELIGGQTEDWDEFLTSILDFDHILGLVVEVKTGAKSNVFPEQSVRDAINRFGFFPDTKDAARALCSGPTYQDNHYSIAKLLISNSPTQKDEPFESVTINHIRTFLKNRLRKYIERKYAERMFFPSSMLQEMISEVREEPL